jgi:antitoxin HicB
MARVLSSYIYPAVLERDEAGRVLVLFPDFPEAATDGADEAEALAEASDYLSEALAGRMVNGEEIPFPTCTASSEHHPVSPDPTIVLKAALYMAVYRRTMTVADLAGLLDVDWHQAARLIDPKRSSKLTTLTAALGVLNCEVVIAISEEVRIDGGAEVESEPYRKHIERGRRPAQAGGDPPAANLSDASSPRKRRSATSAR